MYVCVKVGWFAVRTLRTFDLVLVPDGEGDEEVAGDEQRAVDPVAVGVRVWAWVPQSVGRCR